VSAILKIIVAGITAYVLLVYVIEPLGRDFEVMTKTVKVQMDAQGGDKE
jgi:hypothetical protein